MKTIVFQPTFTDLNPFLTKESIDIHFNHHHMQYYRNLTLLISEEVTDLSFVLNNYSDTKIQNNALQILNHNLFWMSLAKDQKDEEIELLLENINFHSRFSQAANNVFGSGWTWLTYSVKHGFEIFSTANAVAPLEEKPLLVLDLWEHAYYVSYKWNRKEYIEEFFKVINLAFIRSQLESVGFNFKKFFDKS